MQKLYVINQLFLGSRELGYTLYNEDNGVIEMTSKQVKDSIKSGNRLYGLQLNQATDELELDEKFYTVNMMEKRHINNYKPMIGQAVNNTFYIVLRKRVEKGVNVYDVITTRFLLLTLDEGIIFSYLKIGIVSGGAKLENDKIIVPSDEVEEAPKTEAKPEVKTETKAEVEPEVKTEVKQETKNIKPEIKPDPKTEVKSEPKLEIKNEAKGKFEKKQ